MVEATLYNKEYLQQLQDDIAKKLALFTNKDLKNTKYNLGYTLDLEKYFFLWEYWEILGRVIQCSTCYNGLDLDTITSNIKNQLNSL